MLAALASLRARFESRITDPDFQARASLHPIGRYFARRQARSLFDLCAGFTYSQTLVAMETLGIIDQLTNSVKTLEQLAASTNTEPDRLAQLLRAAVALRLLRVSGAGFALGSLGYALAGNPGVRAMIRHHHYLYADLLHPEALLTGGERPNALRQFWAYPETAQPAAEAVVDYSALMAESQRFVADQVLEAYDFGAHRRILDLGGGQGVFVEALARRYPHLDFEVFDLPPVIEQAREYLGQKGLLDRVTLTAGDLFRDPLPAGADLVTLVRVLHDHNEPPVSSLLSKCRKALASNGSLLVAEPMAGPAAKGVEAYFCNYFLAMGQGQLRTPGALKALLQAAGFQSVSHHQPPVPMLVDVLRAGA